MDERAIGLQSVGDDGDSHFGINTVLDCFQLSGTFYALIHMLKIVVSAWPSGSIPHQCLHVSCFGLGAEFSALLNLRATS